VCRGPCVGWRVLPAINLLKEKEWDPQMRRSVISGVNVTMRIGLFVDVDGFCFCDDSGFIDAVVADCLNFVRLCFRRLQLLQSWGSLVFRCCKHGIGS